MTLSRAQPDAGRDARSEHAASDARQGPTHLPVLAAALLLGLLVALPAPGFLYGLQQAALQFAGIAAGCWTVAQRDWTRSRVLKLLRLPPVALALAFLAWLLISSLGATLKVHAAYELLRQMGGMLLAFALGWGLAPRELRPLTLIIAGAGAAAAAYALLTPGDLARRQVEGAFGDPQLLAAVAALLVPWLGMLVRGEERLWPRAFYAACLAPAAMVLALTSSRSAWLGAAAGLIAAALLYAAYGRPRSEKLDLRAVAMPALVTATALVFFLTTWGVGGQLASRLLAPAGAMGRLTLNWRTDLWHSAILMTAEHPIIGWGPGSFSIHQSLFTPGSPPERDLLLAGADLSRNAHNTYMQLAAESGLAAPLLYVAVWCAFLLAGEAVLRAHPPLFQRCAIIGGMAAVIAHLAAASGSPAWEFSQCTAFLWLIAGAGLLALRAGREPAHSRGRRRRNRFETAAENQE